MVDDEPANDGVDLAERYGRPSRFATPRWRRAWLVGAVVVVLALLAWIGRGVLTDPVQWRDVGFVVHGSQSIDVTFEVTKAPEATVTCRVRALSQGYAEVGVRDVVVGPAAEATQHVTAQLLTSETAVSGTVASCRVL